MEHLHLLVLAGGCDVVTGRAHPLAAVVALEALVAVAAVHLVEIPRGWVVGDGAVRDVGCIAVVLRKQCQLVHVQALAVAVTRVAQHLRAADSLARAAFEPLLALTLAGGTVAGTLVAALRKVVRTVVG